MHFRKSVSSLLFQRTYINVAYFEEQNKRKLFGYELTLRSTKVEDVAMKVQNRGSKILSPIKRG